MANPKITIISRASRLAIWQAEWVKHQLQQYHPQLQCEIIFRTTSGDRTTDRALCDIGGKDLFVKDLQQALLNEEADVAVHSLKDMSTTDHDNLLIAAICRREDPRDAFISSQANSLEDLPLGASIGTSSPRRHCQLKSLRNDLNVKLLRGNVDTRLMKAERAEYDAIILAAAGVKRLNQEKQIRQYFDPQVFIPAIGQGALAIECRADDFATQQILHFLDDRMTRLCVTAERTVNRKLNGDCHTPLGAYAIIRENTLYLSAMVGTMDGGRLIRTLQQGDCIEAESIGFAAADHLLEQGAREILS